jgi:hypothetical protein
MRQRRPAAYVLLAQDILRESREELNRADAKSALLLAASGVVISAITAGIIAGGWHPTDLARCAQWVWWLGVLAGIGGTIAFAYAVYPRTKYRGKRSHTAIAYFGDVVSTPADQLRNRLRATAGGDGDREIDQLKAVAAIVNRKYRGIQLGLWLFVASAVLCLASLLLSAVFA